MGTFFFACMICLDFWLKEVEADVREPSSFTTFVDLIFGMAGSLDAAALPFVTDFIQLVVLGRDLDHYQASAVHKSLNTESNDMIFQAVVAAMVNPLEQHRHSLL